MLCYCFPPFSFALATSGQRTVGTEGPGVLGGAGRPPRKVISQAQGDVGGGKRWPEAGFMRTVTMSGCVT